MGKYNLTGQVSGITGKATTMTARSLAAVKTKLENQIRKMMAAKKGDSMSAKDKKKLAGLRAQLKDVKAEIKAEASAAGRSLDQAASNRKKFKGYDPSKDPMAEKERVKPRLSDMTKEELREAIKAQEAKAKSRKTSEGIEEMISAGNAKAKEELKEMKKAKKAKGGVMGFNMGGMSSRKGSFDYRKGGYFK